MTTERIWCVVLATESGPSNPAWTRPNDELTPPPQFAPRAGDATAFRRTLDRAGRIAPPHRTLVVLRRAHQPFWTDDVRAIPQRNRVTVDRDMGSGVAAALATVTVMAIDPGATLVFLPAWEVVEQEEPLDVAVAAALAAARQENRVVLIGLQPDAVDPRQVWLIPRAEHGPLRDVEAVSPTRTPPQVRRCVQHGGLCASSMMVGLVSAWVRLFDAVAPSLVQLLLVLHHRVPRDPWLWDAALSSVLSLDLLLDVAARAPHLLRVVEAPTLGLTDLRRTEAREWHAEGGLAEAGIGGGDDHRDDHRAEQALG